MSAPLPPRGDWNAALAAVPAAAVAAAAAAGAAACAVTHHAVPQAGLALLALRDGVFDEPFNLGEVPLAQARVELVTAEGARATGGAVLLADDADRAVAMAICDALLAARLPGWEAVAELVREGLAQLAAEAARRHDGLARTRVDFSELGSEEDDA